MNNENKIKQSKRKCCSCYQKFPKKEIVVYNGTYRCEPCYSKYFWVSGICQTILLLLVIGLLFKVAGRKSKKAYFRSGKDYAKFEVEDND